MAGIEPAQQQGPCLILVSPWRKRRSIFTTPSPVRPLAYPMNHSPGTVLAHRPPLRIVRISPFPPFIGPRFPNPQSFNAYAGMPTMIPPNTGPVFASPPQSLADLEYQYETILQHQQRQPPVNYTIQAQETFPPTPSTTSEESNAEEVTSTSNQQKDQESVHMGYRKVDSLETDQLTLDGSESANGRVTSSDEGTASGPNDGINGDTTEAKSGIEDSGCERTETQFSGAKQDHEDNNKFTFNNVDEALATIDSSDFPNDDSSLFSRIVSPDSPSLSSIDDANRQLGTRMKVADDKQEEVVKAAKSLFSKRTRTLYHWMFPDTSKNKLKATVSAAWDTLPDNEKHFYISQVLGRFGLQASSLMINPQLDGLKGLTTDLTAGGRKISSSKDTAAEAQRAVEELFASCDDADNWASYPKPKRRNTTERRRKRKTTRSSNDESGGRARLGAVDPDELDEETVILKRMRESKLEAEFEEDIELSSELEKFRLISETGAHYKDDDDDDFWSRTPDPEDLFSQMDF